MNLRANREEMVHMKKGALGIAFLIFLTAMVGIGIATAAIEAIRDLFEGDDA